MIFIKEDLQRPEKLAIFGNFSTVVKLKKIEYTLNMFYWFFEKIIKWIIIFLRFKYVEFKFFGHSWMYFFFNFLKYYFILCRAIFLIFINIVFIKNWGVKFCNKI